MQRGDYRCFRRNVNVMRPKRLRWLHADHAEVTAFCRLRKKKVLLRRATLRRQHAASGYLIELQVQTKQQYKAPLAVASAPRRPVHRTVSCPLGASVKLTKSERGQILQQETAIWTKPIAVDHNRPANLIHLQ